VHTATLKKRSGDDERAEGDEEELLQEADAQHEAAVRSALQATDDDWQLLSQMQEIAQAARYEPDSRVRRLEQLIRQHLCPRLGQAGAEWASERLLIFTEYADTKDWLERRVRELIAGSDQAEARIATFHGGIGEEAARFIKVLEEQRKRITSTRSRTNENLDQLLLDLGGIKEQRLQSIDRTFALQAHRVEPAGAIDLWPTDLHCTDVMYKP
jgi:hypothetical protein